MSECQTAASDSPTFPTFRHFRHKGSLRLKDVLWRPSWTLPWDENQKSATAVLEGRTLPTALPSPIFDCRLWSSPSCASNFHHFAAPRAARESLTGGHVKVMLAYGHSLSYGHKGFRPFTPDHREAAQPVGAAVASVEVRCDHQTVPS